MQFSKIFKIPLPIIHRKSYLDIGVYRFRIGRCRLMIGILISNKFKFRIKIISAWRPLTVECDPYDVEKNIEILGPNWAS